MKTSIIKIPFDACIVERDRRGAAKGPEAVEAELEKTNFNVLKVKELNDFEAMHREVESLADKEYKKKNFVIGLGGDHSVSYGLMKAFAKNHKNAGLIYLDAHLDCDVDFLPPTHEDILRAVVKEKLFKHIFVYGIRNCTEKEKNFAARNFSWDSAEVPIRIAKEHINEELLKKTDSIYISIDIDVFDPKYAPGTGYPEKGGLVPEQVMPVIRELSESGKVKGMDIVEVSPIKDKNNMTSRLAASLLLRFLK